MYIGSDINCAPDPTKYPTNPNTTRYPNSENRTTRTQPDSEYLPEPDTNWVTKFPGPQPEFYPKNAPKIKSEFIRELNVDNWNDNCEAKSDAKSLRPLRGLQVDFSLTRNASYVVR